MSCVLRVHGVNLAVDDFLKRSSLEACSVYYKGDITPFKGRPNRSESGFNIAVSDADLNDLENQIRDAIQFLIINRDELLKLKNEPGVDDLYLNFGIARLDVAAQFDFFPSELIQLLAQFGMGLAISQYLCGKEINSDDNDD